MKFEHLDIVGAETNDDFRLSWQLAMDELRKMNDYKAPRDKMVCLLNACKVFVQLLSDAREDADESPPGADEFLLTLIYVCSNQSPNLFSNLDYIDCFRDRKKLISEPGYWYTNLYSAAFLENVEHDRLSISEEEFAAGITKAKSQMERQSKWRFQYQAVVKLPRRHLWLAENRQRSRNCNLTQHCQIYLRRLLKKHDSGLVSLH